MPKETNNTPKDENVKKTTESGAAKKATAEKKSSKASANTEAALASLEEKLHEAEQKTEELQETLLRTVAEYDNFRKRSQKEHDSAFSNGVSFSVEKLLPVLDTLDAAASADTTDEEYKKGVLLTLTKCQEIFKELGITEIESLGQPFNPELHNAVVQLPAEGAESGTITQVLQKGYKLGDDKVIRHAMVAVAP